jgi:hypothetical protein
MADFVNRIVPPPISRDRLAAPGKEREKKDRDSFQRRDHEEKNSSGQPGEMKADNQHAMKEPEKERTKGKNLDVSV